MRYIVFFLGLIFFGIFLLLVPLVIAYKISSGYAFAYLCLFFPIGAWVAVFTLDELDRDS